MANALEEQVDEALAMYNLELPNLQNFLVAHSDVPAIEKRCYAIKRVALPAEQDLKARIQSGAVGFKATMAKLTLIRSNLAKANSILDKIHNFYRQMDDVVVQWQKEDKKNAKEKIQKKSLRKTTAMAKVDEAVDVEMLEQTGCGVEYVSLVDGVATAEDPLYSCSLCDHTFIDADRHLREPSHKTNVEKEHVSQLEELTLLGQETNSVD